MDTAVSLARQQGKVINNQAARILQTPGAVELLSQTTGMELPGTADRNRTAVKDAIMTLATEDTTTEAATAEVNGATEPTAAAPTANTDGTQSPSDMSLRGTEGAVAIPSDTQTSTTHQASTFSAKSEETSTTKDHISLEDYTSNESPVWRYLEYDDDASKSAITQDIHTKMVKDGAVVKITDDITDSVAQALPDLRSMKKKDRKPILQKAFDTLKSNLRKFLSNFSNQVFEFEVNGKILEAKLYSTGINEVLEKVTREKASMLYSTEEVFRNARYLYSTPDYDGNPNIFRWNYFYTPVQIGEDVVGVRIAIRDVAQGTNRLPESQIYNWGIKKDTPLDGVRPVVNDSTHGVSSDVSKNSIRNPKQNVNPEDTSSTPNPSVGAADRNFSGMEAHISKLPGLQKIKKPPLAVTETIRSGNCII